MTQSRTQEPHESVETLLEGKYPLKKLDASVLRQPASWSQRGGESFASQRSDRSSTTMAEKQTLRPPRSVGAAGVRFGGGSSRSIPRVMSGIVATEEDGSALMWKQNETTTPKLESTRAGNVPRRMPLRRKSESNIPLHPRDNSSGFECSNPDTPLSCLTEYLQSTNASSTASYAASPRVAESFIDATTAVAEPHVPSSPYQVESATWQLSKGNVSSNDQGERKKGLQGHDAAAAVDESEQIDRRDGRSLPRPHSSPPVSAAHSGDESTLSYQTNDTINPNSERMANLNHVCIGRWRQNSRPSQKRTAQTKNQLTSAAPLEKIAPDIESPSASDSNSVFSNALVSPSPSEIDKQLDTELESISAIARLSDVELWEDGGSPGHAGLSDAETLVLLKQSGLGISAKLEKKIRVEQPRSHKTKKRRSKAQAKTHENVAHDASNKASKNRNKSKHSFEKNVVQSNVVPLSKRLGEVCRAVSDAGEQRDISAEALQHSTKQRTDKIETSVVTGTELKRSERDHSRGDSSGKHSRKERPSPIADESRAANNNVAESRGMTSREISFEEAQTTNNNKSHDVATKAVHNRTDIPSKTATSTELRQPKSSSRRNASLQDARSRIIPSEKKPSVPQERSEKPSRLPKPAENQALGDSHATKHGDACETLKLTGATHYYQQQSPKQENTRIQGKEARKPPRPTRTSRAAASRIPVPCKNPTYAPDCHVFITEGSGDKKDRPSPNIEWSKDGVDTASQKVFVWVAVLALLFWTLLKCCPWYNPPKPAEVTVTKASIQKEENICPVYFAMIHCGMVETEVSEAPVDGVLCPSLLETILGYTKCPLFIPETRSMSGSPGEQSLDSLKATLFVSLLAVTLTLLGGSFLRKWIFSFSAGNSDNPGATNGHPSQSVNAGRVASGSFGSPIDSLLRISSSAQTNRTPLHADPPQTPSAQLPMPVEMHTEASRTGSRLGTPDGLHEPQRTRYSSGMHDQLIHTEGDMQIFQLGDISDADSTPESSFQTQTSIASAQNIRQTRAASRRAARRG